MARERSALECLVSQGVKNLRSPGQIRDLSLMRPRGNSMSQILFRFLVGGIVVSLFATLGDVLKPKSFAGLFGAAPSVALATLGLTVFENGKVYAATEARSMIAGSAAFLIYAFLSCQLMM